MKINNVIIPGMSIGGISIGENVFDVKNRVQLHYDVKILNDNSMSINNMITLYHKKTELYLRFLAIVNLMEPLITNYGQE